MWSWLINQLSPRTVVLERAAMRAHITDASLPPEDAFAVRIYNDETTPAGFVVDVLESVLYLQHQQAAQHMLHVHVHGSVDLGRMRLERAQQSVTAIAAAAGQRGYPLRCEVVRYSPTPGTVA